ACGAACTRFGTSIPDSDNARDASSDAQEKGDGALLDGGACGDGGIILTLSFSSTADLEAFVTRKDNNPGPSTELDAGVTLLRLTDLAARDSLWFPNPVPLDTFDVAFETLVTCPALDAGVYCGDGIALVWLDATSLDVAFAGGTAGGDAFGVPS